AMVRERAPEHLARLGGRLLAGLGDFQARHPGRVTAVRGIAEMCFLEMTDDAAGSALARGAAARGLLFKRSAYNFVSLAHDESDIDRALGILDEVLSASPDRGGARGR
ncbi:MAG: hypothetical protein H0U85_02555, partial [Gemmatimonadales bacterium]|nr:hypothetical protein [Gemmatimonadales bacterium]